jgi:hypothetical protein
MRGPLIKSARGVRRYRLGTYVAELFDRVEGAGVVAYLYVLAVTEADGETPRLYVTSEVNRMADVLGGGSHFLGAFVERGHLNMGASDEWADLERFASRALEVAARQLGVAESPEALPS